MNIEEYAKYKQIYIEKIPGLLKKYLKKIKWENFLDLGCGDGSLLHILDKTGYLKNKNVYAIDLSKKRIELAKKINKKIKFYTEDACNIKSVKDNSIDLLVAAQLIEHVKNDSLLLKEIHRILKKNGILYLTTIFKKWYGWYFYRSNGKWAIDPTHLREYSKDSQLLDILSENDFEVIESKKTIERRSLARLSIPVLGYYVWELICQKK